VAPIDQVIKRLESAHNVVVFTGAGVSAESGVPTFRDAQTGLWANFRPEELASPDAFRENPQRIWDWYAWRRQLCLEVEPNAAHSALAAMQHRFAHFALITQNVDGLHQRAGSSDVIELHGNIHGLHCFSCGKRGGEWPEPAGQVLSCTCGGLLRPDIVWFGEMLPETALRQAERASIEADVLLSIGTSSLVYPAAELPFLAKRHGAYLIEVNPQQTPLSAHADVCLQGAAGGWLSQIQARLG
jgi:NAD-dependent deacetylase